MDSSPNGVAFRCFACFQVHESMVVKQLVAVVAEAGPNCTVKGRSGRFHASVVVKQLVAVVAELPGGPNCTVKAGRFHESVVVKQLVAER